MSRFTLETGYQSGHRISQLRFLDSALLHPVCEVGMRGFVAPRDDELLGGPVGEQRLDFRTVLVQPAFAGAFRPSDRQAGSPSRAKGILRPRGDQLRIAATIVPPKSRSKSSPKIGGRQIDDTDTVSIGVANCKHNWPYRKVCSTNYSKREHLENLLMFPTLWWTSCAEVVQFCALRHQNASRNPRTG